MGAAAAHLLLGAEPASVRAARSRAKPCLIGETELKGQGSSRQAKKERKKPTSFPNVYFINKYIFSANSVHFTRYS